MSTLVHRKPGNAFFRDVAEELGVDSGIWKPVYDKLHDETMEGTVPGIVGRITLSCKAAGSPRTPETVEAAVGRHFPAMAAGFEVYSQTVPLLERLRTRGYSPALVSNASDHTEWILDRLGLRDHFDVTVFSHRVGKLTPHPGIYLHAVDRLGIPGSRCAFVGDGRGDALQGARGVGMTSVLVDRRSEHSAFARAEADFVVDDLADVPEVLAGLGNSPRTPGK